ncbi:MAG TPA: arginine deiminase-related protein [Steroidobacteraceae bacterium]
MPDVHGRQFAELPRTDPGAADAVLMVRPRSFGWNPETQASNSYQRPSAEAAASTSARARDEFAALEQALRDAGVAVHAFDDRPQPACPDAVFPNNWLSCHGDGTVVLYPMLAPSRRRERRMDLLQVLATQGGFAVRRLVDLTHHELAGHFLEGTGSLVLDHAARVAHACLSPRTHLAPLEDFCMQLGYQPCVFTALDAAGSAVYHTNVVLSIGPSIAVVAVDNIVAADRERVLERLARPGRELVSVDRAQTAAFAANVLELRAVDGARVLAMSASAEAALTAAAGERWRRTVDRVVNVPIPTIEALGGGSVRCMLAEVFLPRSREP